MGARAAGRVSSPVEEPGHPTPAVRRSRGGAATGAALGSVAGWLARSRRARSRGEADGGGRRPIGGREGEMRNGRLRVVTEARVTGARRGLFYSGRGLRWARTPARRASLLVSALPPSPACLLLVVVEVPLPFSWLVACQKSSRVSHLPPGPWGRWSFDPDDTGPVVSCRGWAGLGWFREGSLPSFVRGWHRGARSLIASLVHLALA